MKYLINRVKISLKINRVMKAENGCRIIASVPTNNQSPRKKEITVIAYIHNKKLKGIQLNSGDVYNFEGYFNTSNFFFNDKIHKVQLTVDSLEPNLDNEYINNIEFVGEFISKTDSVKLSKGKKVCNLRLNFLSENLSDSKMEIAVWNGAVDALDYAKKGQKLHIASFVLDNFCTDAYMSFKVSPFKITLL